MTPTAATTRMVDITAALYEQETGSPRYDTGLAATLLHACTTHADLGARPMISDQEICRRGRHTLHGP